MKLLLHLKLLGMSLYFGPDLDREEARDRKDQFLQLLEGLLPSLAQLILNAVGRPREPAPEAPSPEAPESPTSHFADPWLSWCKLVQTSLSKHLLLPPVPTAPLTDLPASMLVSAISRLVNYINAVTASEHRKDPEIEAMSLWAKHALSDFGHGLPLTALPIGDPFPDFELHTADRSGSTVYGLLTELTAFYNRRIEEPPAVSAA